MRAMILTAGRGERMRPLTDHVPKPLLHVGGRSLLAWHLSALARAGFREVVINHAYLGAQIPAALGDGSAWGLRITYSDEGDVPLETAGGIFNALPLLGPEPFLLVNGDIWTDYDFGRLPALDPDALAALVLVPNPPQHPHGDFALSPNTHGTLNILADPQRLAAADGPPRYTYSGIGIYRPEIFDGCEPGRFPLLPILQRAATAGRLRGSIYWGSWSDVGTPQRLRELDERLAAAAIG